MRRWQKILLTLISLILVILFAAAVILPDIIRDKVIEQVHQDYNRELTIDKIIFNLLSLQIEIRKLDLKESGSERTFVSFDRLKFSFSPRSLIDHALIVNDLTLDKPFVLLEKTGSGTFNFSDFIPPAKLAGKTPAEPTSPFHFSFNNLQITDGTLVFFDSSSKIDLVHHIDDLNLAIPFVGNIPYLVERYIQPALSLRIDGAPLVASGQMKPFDQSIETRLNLNLNNIDLPFYATYLQPFLPFELTNGNLSTQVDISYRVSKEQKPKLKIGGDLSISTLRLKQQGEPLLFLPLLLIQLEWADPFADEYHFSNLSIYDPQLQVKRLADGSLNLLKLFPTQEKASQLSNEAKKEKNLHLTIETLRLREGVIHVNDAVPAGGFSSKLFAINLLVKSLTTRDGAPSSLTLDLKTSHHEQVSLSGGLRLSPFSFEGKFKLNNLPVGDYAPYLQPFLTRTPTGRINLTTDLRLTEQTQQLDKLHFSLTNLQQAFSDKDSLKLKELLIADARVTLPQQKIEISEIALQQGDLALSRNAEGNLPFDQLIKEQPVAVQPTAEEPSSAQNPKWQLHLAAFNISDFHAIFIDGAAPKPAPVEVKHLNVKLTDLNWPQAVLSHWQFGGKWGSGGTFKGAGQLRHTPLMVKGDFGLKQFDLTPLNSYIPQDIRLKLASAKLNSALKFTLNQETKLHGKLSGKLGLRNLSLTGMAEELLRWENLQFDGIQVDLNPLSLAISQVSLNNYLAKIRVRDDGKVNLNQITAESAATGSTTTGPVLTKSSPHQTNTINFPPLRIDELTLQGGEVSFVDKHLPKIYSTTMHELGGRISGLTTEPGKYASVDLRGTLDNHSPLTISGKIAPLAGDLDTDLKVRFTDIDLAPVTPYSGTYLGYAIDKGKLYLDLDYRIAKRQVTASNKIFLDQFTFGEAVDSAEATGLPVRLAVALLKDRKGEIHLDLPVNGSTDDPKFGIFSTVMSLLKNLLVKAATAPFSLLASMFGGGDEFTQISFPAGVATLTAGDLEKLGKLTRMLDERPALKLELSAFIDPENDPEGYRKEELRQSIDAEWQKRAKPAADQKISPDEYLENLRRIYTLAKFPKPRNAFGLQKKLPSVEMEKLLLANIRVGEEELNQLAKTRAAAVQNELIELDPALKPRIFLKNAEITKAPAKNKNPARVEFGVEAD